jgi:hypothetical protein
MPQDQDPSPFIQIRKAYRDRKAFEKSTGKTLKKFRLAGDPITALGIFPFFFVFGDIGALCKKTTLTIKRADWEDRVPGELVQDESYIDILKVEPLTGDEIRAKRNDPKNGFTPVATLSSSRFAELKKKIWKLKNPTVRGRVSPDIKKLICGGLEAGDDLMRKLRL